MPNRPERVARRRAEILAAAQDVFLRKGYEAAGIADIAGKLGIGHGTFYRYFDNKRDIGLAVLDRVIEQLAAAALSEDPEASDDLDAYRAQVRRILDRILALTSEHPRLLAFFQRQGLVIDPERMTRFQDEFARFTERFLINGVDKGFLTPDLDVPATAEALVALIFAGATRAMQSDDPDAGRRAMEAGIRLMFDGIGRRG